MVMSQISRYYALHCKGQGMVSTQEPLTTRQCPSSLLRTTNGSAEPSAWKRWISPEHHQWKCRALCLEKDGCLLGPKNWFSAWDLIKGTWEKEKWRICVVTKPLSTMCLRKRKREWDGFRWLEERGYWGGENLILIMLDWHECFSVFHHLQKDKQRKQRHSICEATQLTLWS